MNNLEISNQLQTLNERLSTKSKRSINATQRVHYSEAALLIGLAQAAPIKAGLN